MNASKFLLFVRMEVFVTTHQEGSPVNVARDTMGQSVQDVSIHHLYTLFRSVHYIFIHVKYLKTLSAICGGDL